MHVAKFEYVSGESLLWNTYSIFATISHACCLVHMHSMTMGPMPGAGQPHHGSAAADVRFVRSTSEGGSGFLGLHPPNRQLCALNGMHASERNMHMQLQYCMNRTACS